MARQPRPVDGVLRQRGRNEPVQITGGLRRRTDALRAVFERTHGDLSNNFRSAQLEEALKALEAKLTAGETGGK